MPDSLLARLNLTLIKRGIALASWAAFQAQGKVFLVYSAEGVHRVIFGNLILTVLLLQFIPNAVKEAV